MKSKKQRWIAIAMGSLLAASLAAPTVVHAATPKKHHVKCKVTSGGKTETRSVASAEECTSMGGKVVEKSHKKK